MDCVTLIALWQDVCITAWTSQECAMEVQCCLWRQRVWLLVINVNGSKYEVRNRV